MEALQPPAWSHIGEVGDKVRNGPETHHTAKVGLDNRTGPEKLERALGSRPQKTGNSSVYFPGSEAILASKTVGSG